MTAPAGEPVQQIAQNLDAEYVGVGRYGTIYRARAQQRCYRLIPGAELSADQRAELRQWQKRPRRSGLAPVVAAGTGGDQQPFGGRWYQVVCYQTGARHSLADAIAEPEPARRIDAVVAALRAVPRWWESIGPGVLPMPADIVLTDAGPQLLPLPQWGVPSVAELLACPERALHLAPAVVRGQAEIGQTEDLFSLAVAALRCFGTGPEASAERLLHRAACAAPPSGKGLEGRLPVWMRRVSPIRAALDALLDLTGPASSTRAGDTTDVDGLVDRLVRAREAMAPVTAIRSLRDSGESAQALEVARAVLVDDPDYDVLVLAASIAYKDLAAPLEALTMLDRAVQVDSAREEAYAEQISVIGHWWTAVMRLLRGAIDDSFTRRLDTTIHTAFRRLPASTRREHAHVMVDHLIWQGRMREANRFAYEWLHDGRTLMWWQFDLMLAYAGTFLELGHLDEAGQLVTQIKKGLKRVRANRSMDPSRVHEHGVRLAEFEVRLHRVRRTGGGA